MEGCGDLNLQFVRSGDMTMDLTVDLSYSGDATYGVDYENLPNQIVLPAEQENFVLPIEDERRDSLFNNSVGCLLYTSDAADE